MSFEEQINETNLQQIIRVYGYTITKWTAVWLSFL